MTKVYSFIILNNIYLILNNIYWKLIKNDAYTLKTSEKKIQSNINKVYRVFIRKKGWLTLLVFHREVMLLLLFIDCCNDILKCWLFYFIIIQQFD